MKSPDYYEAKAVEALTELELMLSPAGEKRRSDLELRVIVMTQLCQAAATLEATDDLRVKVLP